MSPHKKNIMRYVIWSGVLALEMFISCWCGVCVFFYLKKKTQDLWCDNVTKFFVVAKELLNSIEDYENVGYFIFMVFPLQY